MTSIFQYFQNIQEKDRSFWIEDKKPLHFIGKIIKDAGGRLIMITPYLEGEKLKLIYHFDIGNKIYNFKIETRNKKISSLTPIFPNADWLEREIWETYGVEFSDHKNLTHLLLTSSLKTPLFEIEWGKLSQTNVFKKEK